MKTYVRLLLTSLILCSWSLNFLLWFKLYHQSILLNSIHNRVHFFYQGPSALENQTLEEPTKFPSISDPPSLSDSSKLPNRKQQVLDPLIYFPRQYQRAKEENRGIHAVYHISGPTSLFWTSPENSINVTILLPANVTLRQFQWNISAQLLLQNAECEKLDYGFLKVPPIPEAITKEWLSQFDPPYLGGVWSNDDCSPRDKVAILVPYRKRLQNLHVFMPYMHFYLQQQGIDYGIYLIEQVDSKHFNRGKLFNIGFILTQLMHEYSCYILHDIDKLPEDTRHSYTCNNKERPIHMVSRIRTSLITSLEMWKNKSLSGNATTTPYQPGMYYKGYFGGVSAIRKDHFITINGMTNSYWGWGGEDDDLFMRLKLKNLQPVYFKSTLVEAQYVEIYHSRDAHYSHRTFPKYAVVKKRMPFNGLSSLSFNLVDIVYKPWYTHIFVKL